MPLFLGVRAGIYFCVGLRLSERDVVAASFLIFRLRPDGMGEFRGIGIFAAAKMTHLSDDKTVAKMGHPIVAVRPTA